MNLVIAPISTKRKNQAGFLISGKKRQTRGRKLVQSTLDSIPPGQFVQYLMWLVKGPKTSNRTIKQQEVSSCHVYRGLENKGTIFAKQIAKLSCRNRMSLMLLRCRIQTSLLLLHSFTACGEHIYRERTL